MVPSVLGGAERDSKSRKLISRRHFGKSAKVKDAVKLHLAMHYSGIDSSHEVSKGILGLFSPVRDVQVVFGGSGDCGGSVTIA